MGMRGFIAFLIGLVTAAFMVAMVIIVTQNDQSEQLSFLGLTFQGYVGWDLAAAAGLGFILAFLLLIPGRLASAWRLGDLSRQARALEQKMAVLREEYAKLEGQHDVLREEHAELRTAAMSVPLGAIVSAAHEAPDPPATTAMPTNFSERSERMKPPIFLPRIQFEAPERAMLAAPTQPAPRAPLRERLGERVAAGRAWADKHFETVRNGVQAIFQRRGGPEVNGTKGDSGESGESRESRNGEGFEGGALRGPDLV